MNKKIIAGAVAAATAGGAYFLTPSTEPTGHLYVMRGLFGGDGEDQVIEAEFSRGVDDVSEKIAKVHGLDYYIESWFWQRDICATAKANYKKDKKPIFLLGHSLGAKNLSKVAHCLNEEKIPVQFSFYYDTTPLTRCVPPNVRFATNWRRSWPLDLGGGYIQRCNGSKRDIANITVPKSRHVLIDDYESVHNGTLARIGLVLK